MFTINIILAAGALISIVMGIYCVAINYSRYKKNGVMAAELQRLLHSTLDAAKKNKALAEKQQNQATSDLFNTTLASNSTDSIDSSSMLSTILTVLVNKYGDVRLSAGDFMIPDEEYVSVYVDINSKELILSLEHGATKIKSYPMTPFSDPDDNTFH
jgi:hypothetical protein